MCLVELYRRWNRTQRKKNLLIRISFNFVKSHKNENPLQFKWKFPGGVLVSMVNISGKKRKEKDEKEQIQSDSKHKESIKVYCLSSFLFSLSKTLGLHRKKTHSKTMNDDRCRCFICNEAFLFLFLSFYHHRTIV